MQTLLLATGATTSDEFSVYSPVYLLVERVDPFPFEIEIEYKQQDGSWSYFASIYELTRSPAIDAAGIFRLRRKHGSAAITLGQRTDIEDTLAHISSTQLPSVLGSRPANDSLSVILSSGQTPIAVKPHVSWSRTFNVTAPFDSFMALPECYAYRADIANMHATDTLFVRPDGSASDTYFPVLAGTSHSFEMSNLQNLSVKAAGAEDIPVAIYAVVYD